jgi:hypothetical protein
MARKRSVRSSELSQGCGRHRCGGAGPRRGRGGPGTRSSFTLCGSGSARPCVGARNGPLAGHRGAHESARSYQRPAASARLGTASPTIRRRFKRRLRFVCVTSGNDGDPPGGIQDSPTRLVHNRHPRQEGCTSMARVPGHVPLNGTRLTCAGIAAPGFDDLLARGRIAHDRAPWKSPRVH